MLFVLADSELLYEEISRLQSSLEQRDAEMKHTAAKLKTSDELAVAVSRESTLIKRERDRVIAEKYFLLSELKKFSPENYELTIEHSFHDSTLIGDPSRLFGASSATPTDNSSLQGVSSLTQTSCSSCLLWKEEAEKLKGERDYVESMLL